MSSPQLAAARRHLLIAGVAVAAALAFLAAVKPPSRTLTEFIAWQRAESVMILLAIYAALWIALGVRRWASQRPRVSSPLAVTTCALGVASTLFLFTGLAFGILALPCIPVGLTTGTLVLVRETRAQQGHSLANLLGIALLLGGVVFLLS